MGMRTAGAGAAALAALAALGAVAALAAGIITAAPGGPAASAQVPALRGPALRGWTTRGTEVTGAALAASPVSRVSAGICTAPLAYRALAARLSAGIELALHGREGHHAVVVYDTATGVSCQADGRRHFDAASIVKVITLAALLRWHRETGRPLSGWERDEAALMITRSDDDAATDLWAEVGLGRLRHFLRLAKMGETELGRDGLWGLTQVTAHDEMLLLELLTRPNPVLSDAARSYELGLMARVIPGQRWGTPAGAPGRVTVHVKNGWLPDDTGWHVNSIGAFTGKGVNYLIAVLTDDSPSEQYGIGTIEGVARLVQRDLRAARSAARVRLAANVAATSTATPAPAARAVAPAPAARAVAPGP
jgi:hypothetical protein